MKQVSMAEREQLRGLLATKLRILFQILSVFPLKFHYHPIFYPCFYGNSHLIRPIYIKILSVKSVQSTVKDIERGAGNPSMKTVTRILEVLGLEMEFHIRTFR